ncbi:adrenocorticotropic hormone receptor-like [Hydra vulgaris]|uniref:Adrenocorticotropic hormone receptor-like n=1 Tax=Hydra vulgaris TaxID=6087 RepID=A0ABM4BPL1_HYDVU
MDEKWKIAILTNCNIGLISSGAGLFVLLMFKNGFDSTQRCILIQLCLINTCLSICFQIEEFTKTLDDRLRVKRILQIYDELKSVLGTGYYYITFWLVFDRYLHIKLNIKYAAYWTKGKSIILTTTIWSISGLSGILIEVYKNQSYIQIYIAACYDVIIITCFAFFYTYAVVLIRRQKSLCSHQRSIFKGSLVSSSILLIFIVLVAIPEVLLALILKSEDLNNSKIISHIALYKRISFPISVWTDAFVYIFASPQVRLAFKKKLNVLFGRKTSSVKSVKVSKSHVGKNISLKYIYQLSSVKKENLSV